MPIASAASSRRPVEAQTPPPNSDASDTVQYCAILGKIVFFTDRHGIKFVLTDSHSVYTLADFGEGSYTGLAVHEQSGRLYYADYANGGLWRTDTAGLENKELVPNITKPLDVAIYDTGNSSAYIFVTSAEEGRIYRSTLDGKTVEVWKEVRAPRRRSRPRRRSLPCPPTRAP